MGLSEAADHLVFSYSGGVIRRLEIARACFIGPSSCSWINRRSASTPPRARGRTVAIRTAAELEARVGPGADLDDVFNKLVGIESGGEAVDSYAEVKRARRAARQRG